MCIAVRKSAVYALSHSHKSRYPHPTTVLFYMCHLKGRGGSSVCFGLVDFEHRGGHGGRKEAFRKRGESGELLRQGVHVAPGKEKGRSGGREIRSKG